MGRRMHPTNSRDSDRPKPRRYVAVISQRHLGSGRGNRARFSVARKMLEPTMPPN